MTRDELEALIWDVLGITARQMSVETIMLAVDNYVEQKLRGGKSDA